MTTTHYIVRLALSVALTMPLSAPMQAKAGLPSAADELAANTPTALAADSVAPAPASSRAADDMPLDDEEAMADTVGKTRRNTATGFNAIDHLYQRRYRNVGDDFKRKWYHNIYMQLAIGAEQMAAPTSDFRFATLTTFNGYLGKNLNRLNSIRAGLHGDFGFQDGTDLLFGKGGARLDHLFNLSAYFDGYDPTRLFEVSTIMGVGAQVSKLRRNSAWETSIEGHAGLQLKFYTGPRGYFALEPYVGVATDQGDVSGERNWRKYDVFYGANLSYIYYFGNNLPASSRRALIEGRGSGDELRPDSTLRSWQSPWFMELAAGPCLMASNEIGTMSTMGHETAMSIGKWLSPVLGVRLTGNMRAAKWIKQTLESSAQSYGATYERLFYKTYVGMRVDALFNPLGFSRRFSWDAPVGFHLLLGGELGRIVQYNSSDHLNTYAASYAVGAHVWARLTEGVQLFIEPRGTWSVYDIPYANSRGRSMRCTDTGMTLNVGLTVSSASHRNRPRPAHIGPHSRFSVGGGGGTTIMYRRSTLKGTGKNFNFEGWGEWHFSRISGLRLSFEYMSVASKSFARYYDYNMAYPDRNYLRTTRRGVWNRRMGVGFLALNYTFNFTEAFSPYNPSRRVDLSAFVGPALVFSMGDKAELDEQERLQQGHTAEIAAQQVTGTSLAATAGVRLTVRVADGIGVYLSPQFYAWRWVTTPGVDYMGAKHAETLKLGVQYDF